MQIIQLGNDKTALLRDASQLSERQRRPIVESITPGENPTMAEMNVLLDAMILAFVESWTLDAPLTQDGLIDLPIKQYDELRKAVMPFMGDVMPDFGPTPDPATPTVPSVA